MATFALPTQTRWSNISRRAALRPRPRMEQNTTAGVRGGWRRAPVWSSIELPGGQTLARRGETGRSPWSRAKAASNIIRRSGGSHRHQNRAGRRGRRQRCRALRTRVLVLQLKLSNPAGLDGCSIPLATGRRKSTRKAGVRRVVWQNPLSLDEGLDRSRLCSCSNEAVFAIDLPIRYPFRRHGRAMPHNETEKPSQTRSLAQLSPPDAAAPRLYI